MGKLLKEFKEFAIKGNVVDMAIGIIIGSAFSGIVTSLVNDIFMPLIAAIFGDVDFSHLAIKLRETVDAEGNATAVTLNYGNFIQLIVNFILVALCMFAVIKAMNKMKKPAAPAKEARKCPYCKSEIADDATRCPHCTSELKA